MLAELWQWDDEQLEHCHDFIQWMFPLDEPSAFNADAPLVGNEERAAFRTEPQLQAAMRRSLSKFLRFLGLAITAEGRVAKCDNFGLRSAVWKLPNHNWLRITRVLKSLRLLGFEREAAEFWACLKELHETDGLVSAHSFEYWKDAAAGPGSGSRRAN